MSKIVEDGPCPTCNGSTWLHMESSHGNEIQCCDDCSSGVIDDDEAKKRHDIVCQNCTWLTEGVMPEQIRKTYKVLIKTVVNVVMEPIEAINETDALQQAENIINNDLDLYRVEPVKGVLEITTGEQHTAARVEDVEAEEDTYWEPGKEEGWQRVKEK